MRNIKSIHWIVGLTILLLLAGFQVNAQQGRGNGPEFDHGFGNGHGRGYAMNLEGSGRMETFLDLSEQQIEQIEKMRLEFHQATLPSFNKIGEKRAQLRTLISENGDPSKMDKLIDDIGELQVTLKKQSVKNHLKIREVLTEEQTIKFDTHFGNRFAGGGHHFRSSGCLGWGMK